MDKITITEAYKWILDEAQYHKEASAKAETRQEKDRELELARAFYLSASWLERTEEINPLKYK